MKRLLAITLLLTAPVFAQTLKMAQDRVANLEATLTAEKQYLENVDDSATQKVDARTRCEEHRQRLHQVIAEVGTEYTVASQGDDTFCVEVKPKVSFRPIVRRTSKSAPYSSGGSYPLA